MFKPDIYVPTVHDINYKKLQKKDIIEKQGFKKILFSC